MTAGLAASGFVSAQGPEQTNFIDPAAVAEFADEFLPREMARRHIPGLVFVLVSGDAIALARGFGAAQLEPRRPVDPDRTVFRLASVSKTITATAALQLVEQGRLGLRENVNGYLDGFQLSEGRVAISLHHLLTHTAGFDERLTGMAARSARDVQALSDYVAGSMPPRFTEPGRVISYSNHGFALIGLLVQQASGRPFHDYVQAQIFQPLGMRRSGALVGHAPQDLAVAYEFVDGRHRPLSPEYLRLAPAGAFFTTGTDMGRFLIAHLRGGAYQGHRILRPETVALMHAQQFAQTPGTSGWAYGLWEDARDGQRALLHNGGGKGYRALIYLLPQHDAGFFLAYNLADRHQEGELQEAFITQFRRRLLPVRRGADARAFAQETVEPLTGDYLYVRRARTTMEKMISVVNRVQVSKDENGTVTMSGSSGGSVALTPMAPLLFRRADDRGVVAFEAGDGTSPQRLVLVAESGFPAVYERMPFVATLRVQVAWLSGMAFVFLYAAAWRPLGAMRRFSMRGQSWDATRVAAWLGGIASALNLVFLLGFPLTFIGGMEGGLPDFVYGVPPVTRILLFIPPITAFMAIAASVAVVGIWRGARTPMAERLAHSLVALALLSFVLFAWNWKLLPAWTT